MELAHQYNQSLSRQIRPLRQEIYQALSIADQVLRPMQGMQHRTKLPGISLCREGYCSRSPCTTGKKYSPLELTVEADSLE